MFSFANRHTKEARTVSPHPYSEVLRKPEQKDIDTISPRYTAWTVVIFVLFVLEISQVSEYKIEAQRFIFNMSVAQSKSCDIAKVDNYFETAKRKVEKVYEAYFFGL